MNQEAQDRLEKWKTLLIGINYADSDFMITAFQKDMDLTTPLESYEYRIICYDCLMVGGIDLDRINIWLDKYGNIRDITRG